MIHRHYIPALPLTNEIGKITFKPSTPKAKNVLIMPLILLMIMSDIVRLC